jgi:FkbM family methyltransferase
MLRASGVRKLLKTFLISILRKNFFNLENLMLRTLLQVRGYGNHRSLRESGEDFFIEQILSPTNPQVCIDIGANIGDYSEALLKKTNASVFAFEPLLTEFNLISKRLEHYGSRFTPVNLGVGESSRTDVIRFNPNRATHASLWPDINKISYIKNEFSQGVQVVSLDDWCATVNLSTIDFIKIDVEGFEKEVLLGSIQTLRRYKPRFIQIEMNLHQLFRGNSLLYFSELLPEYVTYQLVLNGWERRNPCDPLSNLYLYSNFVFVRNDTMIF